MTGLRSHLLFRLSGMFFSSPSLFWLVGWAFGEFAAPIGIFGAKKDPAASLFILVWLCAWTIGGGFAIYIWFWMLRGREIVRISPTALTIKRDVFGAGRTKNYDITKASRLRFAPATYNPFDFTRSLAFWGLDGASLLSTTVIPRFALVLRLTMPKRITS